MRNQKDQQFIQSEKSEPSSMLQDGESRGAASSSDDKSEMIIKGGAGAGGGDNISSSREGGASTTGGCGSAGIGSVLAGASVHFRQVFRVTIRM